MKMPQIMSEYFPRISAVWDGILVSLTAAALALLMRMPSIPYNVRELGGTGVHLITSVVALACAIYWMANGLFPGLRALRRKPSLIVWLPIALLVHGTLGWLLLRSAVPLESIHDIVGSPILRWSWEWASCLPSVLQDGYLAERSK